MGKTVLARNSQKDMFFFCSMLLETKKGYNSGTHYKETHEIVHCVKVVVCCCYSLSFMKNKNKKKKTLVCC